VASSRPHPLNVATWDVWELPPRLLGSVLMVELFAALLLVVDALTVPTGAVAATAGTAAVLLGSGVIHSEVALSVERVRRRVTETAHISLSSVWTFSAAVLLPPLVASVVVVVLFTYLYFRIWRPAKVPPYREVFSTATVLLAVHATAATLAYFDSAADVVGGAVGPLPILAAMLAYTVVNTCLVVGAIVISSDRSVRQVLGHGDEVVLELATLSLGGLVAMAVLVSGPLLVVFALPPLLVLHRAVLVRQLQQAATIDAKTGLLTAAAWHSRATEFLSRPARGSGSAGLLILDLDHFKRVNDDHGHLAGDMVLAAVGSALRTEVREHDVLGRFGGEEFVMLLPVPDGERCTYLDLQHIGDRIRQRIARLAIEIPTPDGPLTLMNLSVSVGGALFPDDGTDVQDLMAVADSALYAAKRDGRDTVRLGRHRFEAAQQVDPAGATEPRPAAG
jgi:diguanylate cyclase (GGDEF)-like protein